MKAFIKNSGISKVFGSFHKNEDGGTDVLETVVLAAVAALVVLMINTWVGNAQDGAGDNTIGGWVNDLLGKVFDVDFGGTDG